MHGHFCATQSTFPASEVTAFPFKVFSVMSVTMLRDTCVTVQQHRITHAPAPRCDSVIRLLCLCISLQSSLQSPVCPSDVKNYTDTDNDCAAAVISFPKYSPHMCCPRVLQPGAGVNAEFLLHSTCHDSPRIAPPAEVESRKQLPFIKLTSDRF